MNDFPDTQFVITGLNQIKQKAAYLKTALGRNLIDLVDKSSALEAFYVIQKVQMVLSEDSGLMHMSWISAKPTIVLLGATRSDWVRPQNKHFLVFGSDDLSCGNCMQATCIFGDVHCLNRYTPEIIFVEARTFLKSIEKEN